jgi:hypothetical protein
MRGVQTNGAKAGFVWFFVGEWTPGAAFGEVGLRTAKACGSGIRC